MFHRRQRKDDIQLLIQRLSEVEARKLNRPEPYYTEEALHRLCEHKWPGNVRELKNLVKRMVILRPGEKICRSDIDSLIGPPEPSIALESSASKGRTTSENPATLSEMERHHIIQTLKKTHGVVGGPMGAARILGLARFTLQYRIKKYHINPSDSTFSAG